MRGLFLVAIIALICLEASLARRGPKGKNPLKRFCVQKCVRKLRNESLTDDTIQCGSKSECRDCREENGCSRRGRCEACEEDARCAFPCRDQCKEECSCANECVAAQGEECSAKRCFDCLRCRGPENAECERKCASDCECVNECIEKGCPEPPAEDDDE